MSHPVLKCPVQFLCTGSCALFSHMIVFLFPFLFFLSWLPLHAFISYLMSFLIPSNNVFRFHFGGQSGEGTSTPCDRKGSAAWMEDITIC